MSKGNVQFRRLRPTAVYDAYWRFAAERQEIFFKRFQGGSPPWTSDPVLQRYKFTNVYRASDRVSQFLIGNVIYGNKYSSDPREVIFRVILFKIFNKIETWEWLERTVGELSWATFDFDRYSDALSDQLRRGRTIYSAAYIIPPVRGSGEVKHRGHLHLIDRMMKDHVNERLVDCSSLAEVFWTLKSYPSFGDFIAYQIAIDLNYSQIMDHSESEFVVAGPGARDGLSKCFENAAEFISEDLIALMCNRQGAEFDRLGLKFRSLWGRSLQLIDCQNLLCEISKYARATHPDIQGISGRTRIKQFFRPNPNAVSPWYPPKWGLNDKIGSRVSSRDLFAARS